MKEEDYIKDVVVWFTGGSVTNKEGNTRLCSPRYHCMIKSQWLDEEYERIRITYTIPKEIEETEDMAQWIDWGNNKLLGELSEKMLEQRNYLLEKK